MTARSDVSRKTMVLLGVSANEMSAILKKVQEHKDFSAHREIKDMIQYLMFLALFIVVTVDVSGTAAADSPYRVTAMLNAQLNDKPFAYQDVRVRKSFDKIKTVLELHQYLTGPFYDVVYANGAFDADHAFPPGELYAKRGYIGGNSRLVGPIRIGQVRVKAEACGGVMASVPGLFNDPVQCFNAYSAATDSIEPFGHGYNYTALSPKPVEPRFYSHSHHWYGSPTFGVMVPPTEDEQCDVRTKQNCPVYDLLASLKEHKYFDKATRAVFVDLNLYTANIDHTTTARLFAEMLPGGGVTTQVEFLTYRLYPWHDTADFVQAGCEGLIYVVILAQLAREATAVRRVGRKYFGEFSNVAVVCNALLFLFVLAFRVLSYATLPASISDAEFANFRTPTIYFSLARSCQSFNCFLSWLKLFKFLSFIPMFGQLTKTVQRAAGKVLELVVIFALTLVGAALAFYLAFGNFAANYHTFLSSFYTLLHIVTGEMSLADLRLANRVLGPFFFISFVFLMMFVILNIFIVIVSEAYTDTKKELRLMDEMAVESLSKAIAHHFLHDFVYRVPFLGPRVLQPLFARTSDAIAKVNLNATEVTRRLRHSTASLGRSSVVAATEVMKHETAPVATPTQPPPPGTDTPPTVPVASANVSPRRDSAAQLTPLAMTCQAKLQDIEQLMPACLEHLRVANDVNAMKVWLNQFRTLRAQLDDAVKTSAGVVT
ncbi:hypothetical protein H310_07652 [Aphanomyces invadans]|uniref:Uncharacterized protein n=1 Tax=Aphanomyces invadans TaxID=157072 RepID=A0A024U2Z2_9STRA|nr:hypothetical protein H310_07652 [Aphanomyces invadans]ETW00267.1 hypothetical protein H310_07652 [Aphanomyces invadans]|eukprot:XP_008871292.1 hypothetical protein H310_07652 [Aphanomyces invadans]